MRGVTSITCAPARSAAGTERNGLRVTQPLHNTTANRKPANELPKRIVRWFYRIPRNPQFRISALARVCNLRAPKKQKRTCAGTSLSKLRRERLAASHLFIAELARSDSRRGLVPRALSRKRERSGGHSSSALQTTQCTGS